MKKEINKEKIKKYVGIGLLTATLAVGGGLEIYDIHIDHTKEVCPITKMYSIPMPLPNNSNITFGMIHQLSAMENDYTKKGLEDVLVTYGERAKNVEKVIIKPAIKETLEDGTEKYLAPSGYILTTDENGNTICIKKIISKDSEDKEYGLYSTRDEAFLYDPATNEYVNEDIEFLRVR